MQIITYLFRIIAWFNNRLLAQTISTVYIIIIMAVIWCELQMLRYRHAAKSKKINVHIILLYDIAENNNRTLKRDPCFDTWKESTHMRVGLDTHYSW